MHCKSLLHVRDHSKVRGTAHHLPEHIALHVNQYTGEAFALTVDRLADRLEVTPQWVRQLRARLVETGELEIRPSRGRHPNVYIIPWKRCPTCQAMNPKLELPVEPNPTLPSPLPTTQPETPPPPTRHSPQANPQLAEASPPPPARIGLLKENVKEKRETYVNVEINQANPKPSAALTLREEDLVEELVRRFCDEKSRATYRRIVGTLGEDLAYRVMGLTWEMRDRIAVSLGAYFVGVSKQVAKEQGIDLGFKGP